MVSEIGLGSWLTYGVGVEADAPPSRAQMRSVLPGRGDLLCTASGACPAMRTVKQSPYLRWQSRRNEFCRRIIMAVCATLGILGPGGKAVRMIGAMRSESSC